MKDLFSLSKNYREKGDIFNSNNILREIIENEPSNFEALFWLSQQADLTKDQFILKRLDQCLKELNNKSADQISYLYFAIAKVREKQKRYKEAFEFYEKANKQRKLGLCLFNTDAKIYVGQAKLHQKLFESLNRCPNYVLGSSEGYDLVFIIGLPRCGSTLVETILSMAPNVSCFGESGALPKVVHEIDILNLLEKSKFNFNDYYLQAELLKKLYRNEIGLVDGIVVDKTLNNFYLAGLISRVWPEAKIVHVKRNPLDQILSAWKSRFEKGHSYSLNLTDLVKVYISYNNLMNFWDSKLRTRIYTCRYEDLVFNTFEATNRLAKFCGIKWNPKMLSPEDSKILVKTASYKQVREPINYNSVDNWKIYADKLEPYIEQLLEAGIPLK